MDFIKIIVVKGVEISGTYCKKISKGVVINVSMHNFNSMDISVFDKVIKK